MEKVEPIRSTRKIEAMKKYLFGSGIIRNYVLITIGFNTALRISDILSLTWEDVLDFPDNTAKSHVWINTSKL